MKRVLVITYYWPPSGGAGVQRWLKFTKYLPEFGWQPVVYTPENPEAPVDDPSLSKDIAPQAEILKRRILEPYSLYKKFVGMRSDDRINAGFLNENEKSQKKEGISVWIRGNLFIPDARKFWINPSVRFLKKYLKENPVDAIISTGPPHSMHLIARRLKKHFNLPWIADFRDPWTEIDFYDQLRLTPGSDRKHKALEKAVLKEADEVVVIGKTMAERFKSAAGITPLVIANGYDEADFFHKKQKPATEPGKELTIVHVGAMNRDRNHVIFWEAIAELMKVEPQLATQITIKLVGKLDVSVLQSISDFNMKEQVEIQSHLPHDQIIPLLQSAALLYLPINNTPNARSIQPGKLFEYLAAGRPILGIGPVDGDAAEILRGCNAGEMIDFSDKTQLIKVLEKWFQLHNDGQLSIEPTGRDKYTRKNLTSTYSEVLDRIISKAP